jgi:hypothetical protein
MTLQFIRLPSSVSLEAALSTPPNVSPAESKQLAICLHPWSWLGGSMDDPWVAYHLWSITSHSLRSDIDIAFSLLHSKCIRISGTTSAWPRLYSSSLQLSRSWEIYRMVIIYRSVGRRGSRGCSPVGFENISQCPLSCDNRLWNDLCHIFLG